MILCVLLYASRHGFQSRDIALACAEADGKEVEFECWP